MSKHTVRTPAVEFARKSSPVRNDGDVVRRRGVIFRAGKYDHQQFAMSPDELRALAADFSPVPIDAGHPATASPLDGQLGHLEAVEASDDGTTLYGTVAMPSWLEDRLGDAKRLVSASFDRATKRLRSLSLVTRPQIEDAELLAAFCACNPQAAEKVAFTIPKERTPTMTPKEQFLATMADLPDDDDVFVRANAAAVETDDDGDDDDEVAADPAPTGTSNFSEVDLHARLAALEAEREAERAELRRERAANFAADELRAKRITRFEKDNAAALMLMALEGDADQGGTVNFSQSNKPVRGSREALVRTLFAQRTRQWSDTEDIPVIDGSAEFSGGRPLSNGGDRPETDAEYAARVVKQYNGRNRKAGAAS